MAATMASLSATLVPIQQMIGGGLLCRVTHDDPATVIIGLALHLEIMAGQPRLDQGKFPGDRWRQCRPLLSRRIDLDSMRLECPGIEYPADDAGTLAFEPDFLFAARPVELAQGRSVLPDARDRPSI